MKLKIHYQESLHSYLFKKSLDDINDRYPNFAKAKDRARDAIRRSCEMDDAEALAEIEDILEQAEDFKSRAWH